VAAKIVWTLMLMLTVILLATPIIMPSKMEDLLFPLPTPTDRLSYR
jgi:hypothetical protein